VESTEIITFLVGMLVGWAMKAYIDKAFKRGSAARS
jgi:hypothetical protein